MKELDPMQAQRIGGGRDAPPYDADLATEPANSDPIVVIDYNPPQQPQ